MEAAEGLTGAVSLTRRQATATALAAVPAALAAPGTARAAGRRPRTLYLAGDSTAAQKYAEEAPETGWGTALPFFLREGVRVAGHAVNGRSSKSFADEGRLAAILSVIRPHDVLLVQFAHNDGKAADPARTSTGPPPSRTTRTSTRRARSPWRGRPPGSCCAPVRSRRTTSSGCTRRFPRPGSPGRLRPRKRGEPHSAYL